RYGPGAGGLSGRCVDGADGGGVGPDAGASLELLAGRPGAAGHIDRRGNRARVESPGGPALDGGGNPVVPDQAITDAVRQGKLDTGEVTTLVTIPGCHPAGIVVAPDGTGDLYVGLAGCRRIIRLAQAGTYVTLAGTGVGGLVDGRGDQALFDAPVALALDASG